MKNQLHMSFETVILRSKSSREDLGFKNVIIEGDSVTVVKKLQKTEERNDRSVIGGLINEIQGKIRNFRTLVFSHIPRGANEAAHAMAAWERRSESLTSGWKKPRQRSN
ncbi:hypothetical protein PVK06_001649 [Gossypium arboreum]|uniref:RNase H type-1 domain-containing protein n=1 Tax=Gossypium arboreum TaxID=29729 RepID=A0ABR0R2R0_GOSAR|nr:hypothetical protein PVK06_001649 [Gossypium arboreum]